MRLQDLPSRRVRLMSNDDESAKGGADRRAYFRAYDEQRAGTERRREQARAATRRYRERRKDRGRE